VNDVQVNLLGLAIAVVSVVTSGMQQIMCGNLQRKHQLSSHQLLSNTAYIQVGGSSHNSSSDSGAQHDALTTSNSN
jgi:hypothetical protein